MATDPARRRWLGAVLLSALSPWPAMAATRAKVHWAAAWSESAGHRIGLLKQDVTGWSVVDQAPVPTRAHGLLALPDGSLLVVARRPGDWLMRWHPRGTRRGGSAAPTLTWAAPHRPFNGHTCLLADGQHVLVTETDTATGDGLGEGRVTVRHLDRLGDVLADWPTGGRDPHQLLRSPDSRQVWVANGGLASQPERGRTRLDGHPMDASLTVLDLDSGQVRQRWTVDDPWLSLRHLAWHAPSATLGVAMQAEHPDPALRLSAPVLALLQPLQAGASLRCLGAGQPMAGYGGDICATADGFAVSSPRASCLGRWDAQGHWQGALSLDQVCALAASDETVVAAGSRQATEWSSATDTPDLPALPVTLDNHWLRLD